MGGRPIGMWAYDLLKKQPGLAMTVYELVEKIGEEKGHNADGINNSNVTSALAKIAREHPEMGIRRVQRGTYVYSPEIEQQKKDELIMRTIKTYDDGRLILEGTDGEVYLAQRIDVLWSGKTQ